MARKNGSACANPKQIRTDVDCRAARPKFDNGAWSPAKISDVTDGGLLFVTPDESRPGNAASKLWRMAYRFHSRQKTYSIGPYGNGIFFPQDLDEPPTAGCEKEAQAAIAIG